MDLRVQAFCQAYEEATNMSNFAAIGELYAETFLFAGPRGTHPVRKEEFLKVIPKMKAQFASLGLTNTRLASVESENLDSKYVLAKVRWEMALQSPDRGARNFDAFATYILQRFADKLSIVFQLDHQDLAAVIRENHDAKST